MAVPKEYMEKEETTYPCKVCGRKFIRSSLDKHQPVCKKLSKLNRKPFDSGKQRATGSDVTYADVKRAQQEKEKNGGQFPRPHTNWRQRHETFIDAVSSSKKVDYAIKTGAPLPPPPRTAVPNDYPIPRWSESERESTSDEEMQNEKRREIMPMEESPDIEEGSESMPMENSPDIEEGSGSESETVYSWVHRDYVQCEYCGRNFSEGAAERHIPFCRDQHRSRGGNVGKPPTSKGLARPPTNKMTTRDASPSRVGGRGETRSGHDDVTSRRSLESRAQAVSRSASRTVTQSATTNRQSVVPPTPNRRSNSAPRTPANSRLKTPGPKRAPTSHASSDQKTAKPPTRSTKRDTSTSRSRR